MKTSIKQVLGAIILSIVGLFFWNFVANVLRSESVEFAFAWTVRTIGLSSMILGFFQLLKVESNGDLEVYIPSIAILFKNTKKN